MTEIAGNVQQQSDRNASDGQTRTFAVDREGASFTGDAVSKYRQWLTAGKVFEAHFATEGATATVETNGTIELTEPFFRMTCPSSAILVPLIFRADMTLIQTTVDAWFITTSDTDTFTSGGVAPAIENLAAVSSGDSALGATVMTDVLSGDSVLTEAALTNPRQFGVNTWVTGNLFHPYEYNVLKGDPMVYIHGESSLQVQAIQTGAQEVHFSFIWAELDKNALVNS